MRSVQLAAGISLALALPATALSQPPRVSFSGCPVAGAQQGCVLVRSGRRTFDISSATPPIRSLRFIVRGSGVPGGQSICQQGTALTNIRYSVTHHRCAHPRLR